jgi:hypothetical protein
METLLQLQHSHLMEVDTIIQSMYLWCFFNEFIRCFCQSQIANLRIFLRTFVMIYFSTGKLRKKLYFANKKFLFFLICSKFGKTGENI